jgi:predicted nucleic acid-binding protein
MALLVDTSVLVDYFRNVRNDETQILDELLASGMAPSTAPVILQELLQGYQLERDADIARRDLDMFEQLPPAGYDIHRRAARLFREGRRRGLTSSTVDALIVAMAIEHRCDLLTRDATQKRIAAFAGVPLA